MGMILYQDAFCIRRLTSTV